GGELVGGPGRLAAARAHPVLAPHVTEAAIAAHRPDDFVFHGSPMVTYPREMDAAALRACPLFQSLGTAQLEKIAKLASERQLALGTSVFKEGDLGSEMFVVV